MDFSNDFPKPSQPFPPPPVTGTPVGQPPNHPEYVGVNTVRPVTLVQAGPWSTGLCDCCANVPNCCLTCWCPCVTFGQVAEIVDRGSNSCGVSGALYVLISAITGCACIYSCFYRTKMRKQYMLPESPCADFLVHCCCEPCALCQEYRELQHRGFDMTLGWDGNVARENQGVSMPPIVPEGMMK